MASGEVVAQFWDVMPPATAFATEDVRIGSSTPAEVFTVYDFDATTAKHMDYKFMLVGYGGGGLTVHLPWSASSATSGGVRLGVAIRRMEDDAEDIDESHSYSYTEVTDTAASASGEPSYAVVSISHGANMDNWANGEVAIVRVRRNPTHAGDDMAGDLELWGISIVET